MFARIFMIFSVMIFVSACSTTEDAMLDEASVEASGDRDGITAGPLADIYDGSLEGPAPGTQADLVVNVGDRVFFGYDRYDLSAEARQVLDVQAQWLAQYPNVSITVEGHADERGTREYNLALGDRRANSTKNYLVALGVSPSRIDTISFGKERPAVPGSNETAWSQNRRSVAKVN